MAISGRRDLEELASELGLKLFLIKTESHLQALGDPDKLDPDIIFLFDPGQPFKRKNDSLSQDALLKYGDLMLPIRWSGVTKASLRKLILREDNDSECIVCYESEKHMTYCQQCSAALCMDCLLELGMTPNFQNAFTSINTDRRFFMVVKCPECRVKLMYSLRDVYFHIHLDRYGNLAENVRRILISVKESDPNFEQKYRQSRSAFDDRKEAARCFKKGCKVRLHGLKKEEWNGQRAVIIGGKNVKSGAIRWPIQLLNGKKEQALIKQCNLRKLKDFESKKMKKKRKKRKKK